MSKKTKKILLSIPKVLLLCAIGITIFLPLLWMFFSAFKPPKDIISYPPTFVPAEFTLENFERLASRVKIWEYVKTLFYMPFLLQSHLYFFAHWQDTPLLDIPSRLRMLCLS